MEYASICYDKCVIKAVINKNKYNYNDNDKNNTHLAYAVRRMYIYTKKYAKLHSCT